MSLAEFILCACGVVSLWAISVALEGIGDELGRIRQLEEEAAEKEYEE
jgi:hypothetical protein